MEPALDSILKFYLEQELVNGGYTHTNTALKESNARTASARAERVHKTKHKARRNKSKSRPPRLDTNGDQSQPQPAPGFPFNGEIQDQDHDESSSIIPALLTCLEEKGILREFQAFLRQKLVSVLQGTCPQLFQDFRRKLNPTVVTLITDFLCSRKCLFSLSVLSSEIGEEYVQGNPNLTKLKSAEAENLLEELEIKPNTQLCRRILHLYSHNENMSLLECIVQESGFQVIGKLGNISEQDMKKYSKLLTLDERLKKIDEKYTNEIKGKLMRREDIDNQSIDKRFRQLALSLERDKQLQLKMEIEKFKEEELYKIRDQIETELKFELIKKEKELLANYEEKVNHFRHNFEREKEMWLNEKSQKEREILERREELIEAIQSLHQERVNLEKSSPLNTAAPITMASLNESKQNEHLLAPSWKSTTTEYNAFERKEKLDTDPLFLIKKTNFDSNLRLFRNDKPNPILKLKTASKSTNTKIVRDFTYTSSESEPPVSNRRKNKKSSGNGFEDLERDRIALLQYQLERQAEELNELRNANKQNIVVQQPSKPTDNVSKGKQNAMSNGTVNELDQFISESIKRISAIEIEADTASKFITTYNKKKSRLEEVKAELDMQEPVKIYKSNPEDELSFLKNIQSDILAFDSCNKNILEKDEEMPAKVGEKKQDINIGASLLDDDKESIIQLQPSRNNAEAGDAGFGLKTDAEKAQYQNPPPQGSLFLASIMDTETAKKTVEPPEQSEPPQVQHHGSLFLASIFDVEEGRKKKPIQTDSIPLILPARNASNEQAEESNNSNRSKQDGGIIDQTKQDFLLEVEPNGNLGAQASNSGALIKDKLVETGSEILEPDETIVSSFESTRNPSLPSSSFRDPGPGRQERSKNELDNLLDGITSNSQLAQFIKVSYEDIKLYGEGVIEKGNIKDEDAGDGFW